MNIKPIEIVITPEETKNVQKYDIEQSACRELIAYIISNGMNISTDQFEQYQKRYVDNFIAFESAKTELENKYIQPLLNDREKANWRLSYHTNTITGEITNAQS